MNTSILGILLSCFLLFKYQISAQGSVGEDPPASAEAGNLRMTSDEVSMLISKRWDLHAKMSELMGEIVSLDKKKAHIQAIQTNLVEVPTLRVTADFISLFQGNAVGEEITRMIEQAGVGNVQSIEAEAKLIEEKHAELSAAYQELKRKYAEIVLTCLELRVDPDNVVHKENFIKLF